MRQKYLISNNVKRKELRVMEYAVIDMDLTEDECRICHGDNVQREHHSLPKSDDKCCRCHDSNSCSTGKEIEMEYTCGNESECHYPIGQESIIDPPITGEVTDHHNFTAIFGDDDLDCKICHEQGVPRPIS